MKSIYKYVVPFEQVAEVKMHGHNPQVIRVDGIDGQIYMWAIVDTNAPLYKHTFHLFKTGMTLPHNIDEYYYHGCGGIVIGMELMMYVFQHHSDVPQLYEEPPKWNGWPVVNQPLEE